MRLGEISAEILVQLYRRVESWFRSQQPDVEDWAQVVYALALSGRLEEAASIVETMETGSDPVYPQPDARMYNLLIRELVKQRGLSTATSLWSRMAARGLVPDGVYFLLMVAVCASSDPPQLDRAKRYLRRGEMLMKRQKVNFRFQREYDVAQLYTALMAGYLRMGRLTEAFTVLGTMRQHGVRPSAVTFCILQQCCFARMDPSADVRQLLRIMEQIGVPPETSNYNELIKCYGLQGQMTLALGVANRMREAGIAWDSFTYFALIRSVCAAGQVELAMKLLTRMRQDGIRPGAPHYTCTFIGLAAADYYEDATRVFQRLVDVGGARSQFPYNMMMAIHSRRGDMEAAEEVLEEMTEAGWPADVTTYQILVQGYVAACDWPAALALEEKVADLRRGLVRIREDAGVTQAAQEAANGQLQQKRVWTKVYHLLVDAAVYNAEWPRAVQIIEELVGYGLPVNYAKHARLLEDTLPSTRAGLAMKGVYSRGTNMDWATADERQKDSKPGIEDFEYALQAAVLDRLEPHADPAQAKEREAQVPRALELAADVVAALFEYSAAPEVSAAETDRCKSWWMIFVQIAEETTKLVSLGQLEKLVEVFERSLLKLRKASLALAAQRLKEFDAKQEADMKAAKETSEEKKSEARAAKEAKERETKRLDERKKLISQLGVSPNGHVFLTMTSLLKQLSSRLVGSFNCRLRARISLLLERLLALDHKAIANNQKTRAQDFYTVDDLDIDVKALPYSLDVSEASSVPE
ncbi:Rf1, partial [Symbiodinium sp. CCMP2456]